MGITVEIKPHHLIGNNWQHGATDPKRSCPLEEALSEMGYTKAVIWEKVVFGIDHVGYEIDTNVWNPKTAEEAIWKAENGSKESVFVNLKNIEF